MILDIILSMLVCSFAYAIKGGSGAYLFRNWKHVREKAYIYDRLLDGKVLSTIIVSVYTLIMTGDPMAGFGAMVGWLAAVGPSMGEEHGAVGDYKSGWGEYIDKGFGREYGIKKAIQRGAWIGFCMALVTWSPMFLLGSLLFVPMVFIGQCLNLLILKKSGWALAEPLIGAVVIGLPMGLFLGSMSWI